MVNVKKTNSFPHCCVRADPPAVVLLPFGLPSDRGVFRNITYHVEMITYHVPEKSPQTDDNLATVRAHLIAAFGFFRTT